MDWFTAGTQAISNNPYTSFGFVMSLNDYRGLDVPIAKLFLIPTGKLMVPAGEAFLSCTRPLLDDYKKGKKIYGTDNQEKDEKQSQNDKTGLGMEKDCER
ncbi:hypothetical protein Tco_0041056 [Tanacetum coccineum]